MKNFSFKRMMMFSRLLLNNACGYSIPKAAGVIAAVILFCILLPVLTEDGGIREMMDTSENLLQVLLIIPLPCLFSVAIGTARPVPGIMIPATLTEKYVSVFLCAAAAAAVSLCASVIIGTASFEILRHFMYPDGVQKIQIMFFRDTESLLTDIPLLFLTATALQILWAALQTRRKTGKAAIAAAVCGYLLLIFTPALLMTAGIIGQDAARISTAVVLCLLTVLNIRLGYLLMKHFEFDMGGNE